jgi:hypothetical protein
MQWYISDAQFFSEPATKTPAHANVRASFSGSAFFKPKKNKMLFSLKARPLARNRFEGRKEFGVSN